VCSHCGHELQIDKRLAMETALSIQGDEGPCSAKNMSFAQTALYIRTLELRWMQDQRRVRELERHIQHLTSLPFDSRQAWQEESRVSMNAALPAQPSVSH